MKIPGKWIHRALLVLLLIELIAVCWGIANEHPTPAQLEHEKHLISGVNDY